MAGRTRRDFLRTSGLLAAGLAFGPKLLLREARGDEAPAGPVLVHVFQRGGMDGLSAVVPHGDKAYYSLRKNTAIPPPRKDNPLTAADLDSRFGLHPALRSLSSHFEAGRLAVVHAIGSPDPTRSHFDAQDYMETGTPGIKGTDSGWLSRYVTAHAREGDDTFRAVALTQSVPRVMKGDANALAIANFDQFDVGGGNFLGDAFGGMYEGGDDGVHRSGQEAFDAVRRLKRMNPTRFKPENGAAYPRGQFGRQMLSIAQLIKAGVDIEIAFADIGGWDTHLNQGAATGGLANRLRELGEGLSAFATDLGDRMERVVVVTLTEFGRTAKENGTNGTDHGHGSASFVLGGPVKGGKVYGRWPGLTPGRLFQKRDLDVTTDFRDLLAEILAGHLAAENLEAVFPKHKRKKVGVIPA